MYRLTHYAILCPLGGLLISGLSYVNQGFPFPPQLEKFYIPIGVGIILGGLIASYLNMILRNNEKSQAFFINLIETLAAALDERDTYTNGHSRRVTQLASALGRKVGLNNDDLKTLQLAGILHDIGKIGVTDSVLLKEGKLNEEEYAVIKQHPVQGKRILKNLHDPRMKPIIRAILHHHERYDGAGYPDGLRAEDIPLLSRIIAVVDTYDAMTSTRPYRKEMSKGVALKEIEKNSNTQFDPNIALAFANLMRE